MPDALRKKILFSWLSHIQQLSVKIRPGNFKKQLFYSDISNIEIINDFES